MNGFSTNVLNSTDFFFFFAIVRWSAVRLTVMASAFDKIILNEILRGFAEYNTS